MKKKYILEVNIDRVTDVGFSGDANFLRVLEKMFRDSARHNKDGKIIEHADLLAEYLKTCKNNQHFYFISSDDPIVIDTYVEPEKIEFLDEGDMKI